ncbi:endosome-associated-trafficking regulator 1 isoform X1 [Callorhinchus milii]|uniref:endosome-associated-trafficking regulator 1 isoform X1 n=1 Tax=Callorhinchus milii TaxID=7868 RepID=UPI001C3FD7BE|nr:endosome-associated-trafficking regulator 1 isoform X1 [Callorhinchus milii]
MGFLPRVSDTFADPKIVDDQEGDPDETNPFSFKEFIKTKSQSVTKEKERKRQTPKKISSTVGAASHRVCMASKGLSLKLPFRGHCSPDPMEHSPSLDEDEDDWSEAYQPAAIEVAHDLCQASFTSLLLSSKEPVQQVRPQYILSEWEVDDEEEEEEKVNDDGDAPVQQYDLDGEVLYQTQFLNDEKLKEENTRLRMQIKEAKRLVKDHAKKARKLEAELESRKIKEEKETRALESMVQQVEQNLQLMTKQAAKAENIVGKLKQELAVVQNQRDQYKIENERLRHADSEALNTAKTNARVASTYLRKTTQDAETSVKQLLSGAETLRLVSDLLRSVDRISELQPQDKESEQS